MRNRVYGLLFVSGLGGGGFLNRFTTLFILFVLEHLFIYLYTSICLYIHLYISIYTSYTHITLYLNTLVFISKFQLQFQDSEVGTNWPDVVHNTFIFLFVSISIQEEGPSAERRR